MSVDATVSTWKLKNLTSSERLFLLSCADRAGENGICWPSIKRLCTDTCLNKKTIISVRQSIIEKKLLEFTGKMEGRTKSVPVMRLTYVKHRCDKSETSGPENGTASNSSGPENGTAKQTQYRVTEPKRIEPKINTTTSTSFSSSNPTPKPITPVELIEVFKEELPDNPHDVISSDGKSIDKAFLRRVKDFKKYWRSEHSAELTINGFRAYLIAMKDNCSGFCDNEYSIIGGTKESKNSIAVFINPDNAHKAINGSLR